MITHAASRKQYTVLLDRPEGMAFLFWLGIRGARSAVVRPNAFLRRKSAAFSACNAENIRKCNRHGASEACGVSRLSFHFLFSKNECIFAVMRPDPDLTQTGAKTWWTRLPRMFSAKKQARQPVKHRLASGAGRHEPPRCFFAIAYLP